MVAQIPEGTMVDIEETDQDGKTTTTQVDARKELEDKNKRIDTFDKILNCLSG